MKEESVDDRDGWGVDSEEALDIAAGLASRRLGRLNVMFGLIGVRNCESAQVTVGSKRWVLSVINGLIECYSNGTSHG